MVRWKIADFIDTGLDIEPNSAVPLSKSSSLALRSSNHTVNQRLLEVPEVASAYSGTHRRRHTAFYIDCRLYKVSPTDAERARKTIGAPLPALPGEEPGSSTELENWDLEGDEASEVKQSCAQLQGLFLKKVIKDTPNDMMLFKMPFLPGNDKHVRAMEGLDIKPDDVLRMAKPDEQGPGATWIYHAATKSWFVCYIEKALRMKEPMMKCIPYLPKEKGYFCGIRVCDQDRTTYKTICLKKAVGSTLATLSGGIFGSKCLYVGHNGEVRPYDIAGKPVDYGVFILQCPFLPLLPSDISKSSLLLMGNRFLSTGVPASSRPRRSTCHPLQVECASHCRRAGAGSLRWYVSSNRALEFLSEAGS